MDALLILSRAIHFGACLLLFAMYAVRLLIERPSSKRSGWTRLR